MNKAVLKWAGGKSKLLPKLSAVFEADRKILVEPFVGSAIVALNTDFDEYILGDINPDLINLYKNICGNTEKFIELAAALFDTGASASAFDANKARFNSLPHDDIERSALFLYLNKFGFNGLCRYNGQGKFNVSFGGYDNPASAPRLAVETIRCFADRMNSKKVTWVCGSFKDTLALVDKPEDTVVYLDPPYFPVTESASFTKYAKEDFNLPHHLALSGESERLMQAGAQVVLSNSDTIGTLTSYATFTGRIYRFNMRRSISCKGDTRAPVGEVLVNWSKRNPPGTQAEFQATMEKIVKELVPEITNVNGKYMPGPWKLGLDPGSGELAVVRGYEDVVHPRRFGFRPELNGAYARAVFMIVYADEVTPFVTMSDFD